MLQVFVLARIKSKEKVNDVISTLKIINKNQKRVTRVRLIHSKATIE